MYICTYCVQSFKCHSKVTSDFVFVGSSSLIATAGHSADNRNVCLWDTLLPQRRSLVQGTDPCIVFFSQWIPPVHRAAANSIWLKIPNVIYFTDEKCQSFVNTIYDRIICYYQINAKLMPKLSVIAKMYAVGHNYRTPRFLLYSTQASGQKLLKKL